MHHWQDIVLSIGSLVLALALVPSVFSKAKPALWTCALTSAALIAFIVAYASLSLWYTTVTTSIAALLWLTLLIQNLIKD